MSYFFITTLQSFLPIALLLGLNWSHRPTPEIRPLAWVTLLALIVGTLIGVHFPQGQAFLLGFTVLQAIALIVFLIGQCFSHPRMGYLWQAVLVAGAAVLWGNNPNLSALTTIHVVNTDLLLNFSAVVVAFGWLVFCSALCGMIVRRIRPLRWPLLMLLVVLLLLPISGSLLLLLMKLQVLGLTKPRLSYVAHVTNSAYLLNYLSAFVMLIVAASLAWPLWHARRDMQAAHEAIKKRKATAGYRNVRRTLLATVSALLVVVCAQLYWDKIASQPPRLSEAQPVTLAADGNVHIPIEQVRDGKLHRFVWIADDGKAVRFFVINRYPDRLRLGVVFDACLLCGDQGYVMEGNQVICVACGVHIFIPSIGKAGGCNPVPIEGWRSDEKELVIGRASLAAGTNYFSTVVALEVIDPVDGSKLTNLSAEHHYRYGGKTYFFSSEANYNRFRESPADFVTGKAAASEAAEEH
ncbi:Fe-S-containing protein [Pectobacterium cacticida]|uniref:Fe-S-containing protein n=1 Tax=Pectobacterium cacticida TaxID=69221 RepID=A0ABZ2GDX2_9GAMM|nr:Fe-S-containing protein [Pectobacterium cacticida]UYX05568.1 Fe-S-containing protein [Pectobacterium cacticida]